MGKERDRLISLEGGTPYKSDRERDDDARESMIAGMADEILERCAPVLEKLEAGEITEEEAIKLLEESKKE